MHLTIDDRGQLSKYVHHKRINANNRNMSYYEYAILLSRKLKSMINNQDKQHEWGYQHHYGHRDYRKYQHTVNNSNTDNNNTKDINANDDGQGNNNHISSNNKKY